MICKTHFYVYTNFEYVFIRYSIWQIRHKHLHVHYTVPYLKQADTHTMCCFFYFYKIMGNTKKYNMLAL